MPIFLILAGLIVGYYALRSLLELVITAVIVVVTGAITGTVAGLAALLAGAGCWFCLRVRLLRGLAGPAAARVAPLKQQGTELIWVLDREAARRYAPLRLLRGAGLCGGLAAIGLIVWLCLVRSDFRQALQLGSGALAAAVLGCIAIIALVPLAGAAVALRGWEERAGQWLEQAAGHRLAAANGAAAPALAELRLIGAELDRRGGSGMAASLYGPLLEELRGVPLPVTAAGLAEFREAAARTSARLRQDEAALLAAADAQAAAATARERAETAVREKGSPELCGRLGTLSAALGGDELRSLLARRQWVEFRERLRLLESELRALAADAAGSGGGARSEEARGEQALLILGVPPMAEAAQIKQVYRALALAWHADTSGLNDETRMKELNAAFARLKQAGRV